MPETTEQIIENVNDSLNSWQERYEEGMTHEEQAHFAHTFHDLLIDCVDELERLTQSDCVSETRTDEDIDQSISFQAKFNDE